MVFAALTAFNEYITIGLSDLNRENERATSDKDKTLAVAHDLLMANQATSRFSRSYVVTGDAARRDFYEDILDILDGKISAPENYSDDYWDRVVGGLVAPPTRSQNGAKTIEDVFLNLQISNLEFSKLKEAKMKLFELSNTEIKAMDIARDYYAKRLDNNQKKTSNAEIQSAINLLNNKEYNLRNAEIAQLLTEFKSMIQNRYAIKIDKIHQKYRDLMQLNNILSICLSLMILFSSFYLYFRIEKRGVSAIITLQNISNGDLSARSNITGTDEIGRLASLVNWTGSNLQKTVDELNDKVIKTQSLMEQLKREKDRTEKLLHNILPAAIAERLANGEASIAEVYPEVTVMFSDIVGFTDLSAKLGPTGTVEMLNTLFGAFDELAEKHQVEKIKTIGDCYMVVAGVPNRDPYHCQHIAEFALDTVKVVEEIASSSPYPIKMRMGIHTGTVAAGVVGKKKFSYDLWGDVVNIASRFETTSLPDKIHVSEAVRIRLEDDFLFHDSGNIELKGKGLQQSYYLLGKKREVASVVQFKKK